MARSLLLLAILALTFFRGARLKTDKIVGGTSCTIQNAPFLVSLSQDEWNQTSSTYRRFYSCGGSLLSSMWVLTAAHCFLTLNSKEPIYITAGQTCQSNLASPGIQMAQGEKLITHPKFSGSTMMADLALLKLKTPIRKTKFVQFVKLMKHMEDSWLWKNCNSSYVAGWGSLYAMNDKYKPMGEVKVDSKACLNCLELSVIPTIDCMRMNVNFTRVSADKLPFRGGLRSVLCARREGKDTCEGDSGGPLMCHGKQIGIVSMGVGCAYGPIAPIYTRIDYYYRYIKNVIASVGSKRS